MLFVLIAIAWLALLLLALILFRTGARSDDAQAQALLKWASAEEPAEQAPLDAPAPAALPYEIPGESYRAAG